MTPLQAIKQHCYHCQGDNWKEVPKCPVTTCALWPYRFGHDPARRGKGGPKEYLRRGNAF